MQPRKSPRGLLVFLAGVIVGAALMGVISPRLSVSRDTVAPVSASVYSAQTYSSGKTSSSAAYIGNKNTKKFHKSTCSYVDNIKQSNKVTFSSRSAAISAGYVGCKVCNP